MKRPANHYEKALVPEHLTKLTVEKITPEKTFYIEPGERDSYNDDTAIFVAPDRRLMMSRSFSIDPDDSRASSPIGRVGITRLLLMNPQTMEPRQVFIADLRFLEDHQLIDSDDLKEDMVDQESFMESVAVIEDSVPFDAFIAPEQDSEILDKMPKGTFYGDPELYPHLKKLRKRGNKVMQRVLAIEAERKPGAVETVEPEPSPSPEVPPAAERPEEHAPTPRILKIRKFLRGD